MFVFFFQAEDGIRDGHVTGVQTCALPISNAGPRSISVQIEPRTQNEKFTQSEQRNDPGERRHQRRRSPRSEERRVGKECRSRGKRDNSKKKEIAPDVEEMRATKTETNKGL